nr:MAG TPA: hypothetical protein [Caudoviricetes sp.]DAS97596.1 MAG TPA: hypothetical protein [Caudoviricetes sp.]
MLEKGGDELYLNFGDGTGNGQSAADSLQFRKLRDRFRDLCD